jgi:two-component system cell cycle sensor histidine kinase/response regulator CckA
MRNGSSLADCRDRQDSPAPDGKGFIPRSRQLDGSQILLTIEEADQGTQAGKAFMDTPGTLMGGIVHDFNNLLTTILAYSSILKEELGGNAAALRHVSRIQDAGERAASLSSQLLALSRRVAPKADAPQPGTLDLNTVIADLAGTLEVWGGERITLRITSCPDLCLVHANGGEIGRAIMNLAMNAIDAMAQGGTLTVETANVAFTRGEAAHHGLAPGRYASIAVGDNGAGMEAETLVHIFEPFFTTKDAGKGTGLGLTTVKGIVDQYGGVVRYQCQSGKGTTFTIFLPAVSKDQGKKVAGIDSTRNDTSVNRAPVASDSGAILLVEDDEVLRKFVSMVMKGKGYSVLEAGNGVQGVELCGKYEGQIDLLITDMHMPGLGGRKLAEAAVLLRPDLKIVLISGGLADDDLNVLGKQVTFLQKPFTPATLVQTVRETLERPRLTQKKLASASGGF